MYRERGPTAEVHRSDTRKVAVGVIQREDSPLAADKGKIDEGRNDSLPPKMHNFYLHYKVQKMTARRVQVMNRRRNIRKCLVEVEFILKRESRWF